jgi:hypothetical protein
MKQVTKEMIHAGHAVLLNVLLETGHIAMSASLLERIYLSMEQASPQPQREWQGLTEEEREQAAGWIDSACLRYRHDFGLLSVVEQDYIRFQAKEWAAASVEHIEAALKEKNT